jgi:hypothetical protein
MPPESGVPEVNMKEKQHDENKPEDALRLLHKRDAEELDNRAKRLIQALSRGGCQSPDEGPSTDGVHAQLDELSGLSRAWDRLAKKKKIKDDEGLWGRLLDACRQAELESLRQQGYPGKSVAKLVRFQHAWWDPEAHQFLTGSTPPDSRNSVQVVVVQRDAGFRIHEEILLHLWQHPVFAEEFSRHVAHSPHDGFRNTLESVDVIARDYGYEGWEHFPTLGELDGPDRRAIECIMRGLELRCLLESRGSEGGGFLENDAPKRSEPLGWLSKAKKGERLWRLLNAAVELGKSMNHYSTFRDTNIEESIRRLHTFYPGKGTTNAGKAIERIITAAKESGITKITAGILLTWLEGKKPYKIDDPLIVTHSLWSSELVDVSWEKFENLVKSAERRGRSARN